MEKVKQKFKTGLATILSLAMVAGIIPALYGGAVKAQAANGNGTRNIPDVTAFATKNELMTAFTPDANGNSVAIGKLNFGKNSDGKTQTWYILGSDAGVSGDNTIIFAASQMTKKLQFNPGGRITVADIEETDERYSLIGTCDYTDGIVPVSVRGNHYGISSLRAKMQSMETDTAYFTEDEQNLMNATAVTTLDELNGKTYTTTDKLYILNGDNTSGNDKKLLAGSSDSTVIAMNQYWNSGDSFWGRGPYITTAATYKSRVLLVVPGNHVGLGLPDKFFAVPPASNLNLSTVLFASAAKSASASSIESGVIPEDTAMTLRLDGSGQSMGNAFYDIEEGVIVADKDTSITGTSSLVVQGNDGSNNWYYSVLAGKNTVVTAEQIKNALSLSSNPDLADCKIWIETTKDNVAYAKMAEKKSIHVIDSVTITGMNPTGGKAFNRKAACTTTGIATTTPAITYTINDGSGDVPVTKTIADWNKTYKAKVTLAAANSSDTLYILADSVSVTIDGDTVVAVAPNTDGTLTVTKEYTTTKRKITSVTAPSIPTGNTFTSYYTASDILSGGRNSELGTQAEVSFEGTAVPVTANMDVTWTLENTNGAVYNAALGAENTFRWTVQGAAFANYDVADLAEYDNVAGTITDTVTIKNKAAMPVSIIGTDAGITYTGVDIDVTQYFTIDSNAGTPTYSLITGAGGGTGVGTLNGSMLTVTQTGTFKIKADTAPVGNYAAGQAIITLTVGNGIIEYSAVGYSGTYDGQVHSIDVNVTNPVDTTVTYSTDGTNYGAEKPQFTGAGNHTVYYKIEKENYNTINESQTVTISKKDITITAGEQNVMWGTAIDQSQYTVSENSLVTGDTIDEVTLTPSTTLFTENGTITISSVKIVNAAGIDVTDNYNISKVNGILKVNHDTDLAPSRIEASKIKTSYMVGDTLNVDDITVTVYYEDGYSKEVTGYTTNASDIDMSVIKDKILTVTYMENGEIKTADITITIQVIKHTITATAGANGSIFPSGAVEVVDGDSQTFNITPDTGYVIDTLKVDGKAVMAASDDTFTNVTADHTIAVTFKQQSQTKENVPVKTDNIPKAPKTGENTQIIWMITLLMTSGAAIGVFGIKRRKSAEDR